MQQMMKSLSLNLCMLFLFIYDFSNSATEAFFFILFVVNFAVCEMQHSVRSNEEGSSWIAFILF